MTNLQNASAIVVSHNSSLRAIRFARCRYGYLPWRALSSFDGMSALAHSSANEGAIDEAELVRHGCWNGTDRQSLEVLLPSKGAQRTRRGVCQHVCSRPLPQGSICEVSRNLYCTSPALTLLQLSATQDLPTALAIAFELCGTFSLSELATDPIQALQDLKSPTYHEAEAVLTRTRLIAFLSAMGRGASGRVARTAIRYALDSARSPMEAIMAAMLHMPHAYGGFNIAMQLNRKIDFSEAAQAVSGMPYAVCDAYVPEAHASVEYNGDHHSEGKARIHDERRKLGLAAMGIETFTINFEQLRDVCALESVAQTIYRRMGKQYRNRANASRVKQVTLLNGLRRAFGLNPC